MGCATRRWTASSAADAGGSAARLPSRRSRSTRRSIAQTRRAADVHARRRETSGARARKTFRNTNTAWWDASQIYGYDATSRSRVKRDPRDPAQAAAGPVGSRAGAGERRAICRVLDAGDPINPQWAAGGGRVPRQLDDRHELLPQRVRARAQPVRRRVPPPGARRTPTTIPACAIPREPDAVIRYRDVTPDELFEVGAAGRLRGDRQDPHHRVDAAAAVRRAAVPRHERQLERVARRGDNRCRRLRSRRSPSTASAGRPTRSRRRTWYSVFASGPGIFGLGSHGTPTTSFAASTNTKDIWSLAIPTTSTAASIISGRRSISPKSSSRCTACTRWCRT